MTDDLFADRMPTVDDMAHQDDNTASTYARGDLVIDPAKWGRAVLVVLGTAPGYRVAVTLATRGAGGGYTAEPGWTEGHYDPRALVRVDPDTLNLDPLHQAVNA